MSAWIVFDRKTGAYDGVYKRKEMAQGALDSLTTRVPQADWELREFSGSPALPTFDFWINIYQKEHFGEI